MTIAEVRTFRLTCDHYLGCDRSATVTVTGTDIDDYNVCCAVEAQGWKTSNRRYYDRNDEPGYYWHTECGQHGGDS